MSLIGQGQFWKLLQIDDTNPEYHLFESIICEFTDISGWSVLYYIKLESENLDELYGEDPTAEYTEGFKTVLVYEPTEEDTLLSSFGISGDDTLQYMMIPKEIFKRDVEENYSPFEDSLLPKVGDCIRTLWNNNVYELVNVGAEAKIFQGRKMIWEFVAKPFNYAHESDSAEDLLFDIDDDEFPSINFDDTTTESLTGYDDSDNVNDESWTHPDSSIYGY